MSHPIVGHEEWLTARQQLLAREKELTRLHDEIRALRRALPWEPIKEDYTFQGSSGPVRLSQLFGDRSQLFIYHFMLAPDSDHICNGCAFISDHVDAALQHFEHADLSFAAVSRAKIERIQEVRKRLGWSFTWVSSHDNSFNYDYGVSFTPEQRARGEAIYNYTRPIEEADDLHGCSVFAQQGGQIYHTYSTYARGGELLLGAFNFLDMVPKGRNEPDSIMQWLKLHDEYTDHPR